MRAQHRHDHAPVLWLAIAAIVALTSAATGTAHGQLCVGDCDRNGRVDINELAAAVNGALGGCAES